MQTFDGLQRQFVDNWARFDQRERARTQTHTHTQFLFGFNLFHYCVGSHHFWFGSFGARHQGDGVGEYIECNRIVKQN